MLVQGMGPKSHRVFIDIDLMTAWLHLSYSRTETIRQDQLFLLAIGFVEGGVG